MTSEQFKMTVWLSFMHSEYLLVITVDYIVCWQARHGEFCDCLSTGIIPSLIDAGFVFVVRWALDDSVDNSLTAAIDALHALIVCTDDEVGIMQVIIRAFIHFISHSFARSFIHSLTRSFIHSFTHLFIHSLIHSFIRSLTHSFIHSLIHSFITCSFSRWKCDTVKQDLVSVQWCTGWAKKSKHTLSTHNFVKYWPIFKILSLSHSPGNLQ